MWETTLAGLTIPGPCRTGQFGQSFRTCQITGVWDNIDYSDCYDMGCLADGGMNRLFVRHFEGSVRWVTLGTSIDIVVNSECGMRLLQLIAVRMERLPDC